jgi:hypothetical protein
MVPVPVQRPPLLAVPNNFRLTTKLTVILRTGVIEVSDGIQRVTHPLTLVDTSGGGGVCVVGEEGGRIPQDGVIQ